MYLLHASYTQSSVKSAISNLYIFQIMKKIVFVEKQQHTYDSVEAFFKKKAPTVPKSSNPLSKPPSKQIADKKLSTNVQKVQRQSTNQINQQKKQKTGMAVQVQGAGRPKPYPTKQQILKTRDLSKTNIKKVSKASIKEQNIFNLSNQKVSQPKPKQQMEDSIDKLKQQKVISKPQKKQVKATDKDKEAITVQRIQQLQSREQQYIRKLQQFEAKQQKFVKNEQKLAKIQKQLKVALQKSRQGELALSNLKQKQNQIKQMLKGNEIPFNRKREVILSNKIRQLKRINRQLVLRIKNYKGTDLVEIATQQNRQEITKQLYTISVEEQLKSEMNTEMESIIAQLIDKLNNYLSQKIKTKGVKMTLNNQQTFLLEIINISQKISLNFLNNYDLCPLSKNNQSAISAYSILEQYKNCNEMNKIIDRFSLNFDLSKENMQIIQHLQQGQDQQLNIKAEIKKQSLRKNIDKAKIMNYFKIFEQKANYNQILLIQKICQLDLIKDWVNKANAKINQELNSLSKIFSEIKDIVQLGPNGKESLFFYLSTNTPLLYVKFPDLKKKMKQIHSDFTNLQIN